jgi:hypothetical protein
MTKVVIDMTIHGSTLGGERSSALREGSRMAFSRLSASPKGGVDRSARVNAPQAGRKRVAASALPPAAR